MRNGGLVEMVIVTLELWRKAGRIKRSRRSIEGNVGRRQNPQKHVSED